MTLFTDHPFGVPPTEDQFAMIAITVGVSDKDARDMWHYCEGLNWFFEYPKKPMNVKAPKSIMNRLKLARNLWHKPKKTALERALERQE